MYVNVTSCMFPFVSSDSICLSSDLSWGQAKIVQIIHFFRFQVITTALEAFLLVSSDSICLSSDFSYGQATMVQISHGFRFPVKMRALEAVRLVSSDSSYLSSDSFKYVMFSLVSSDFSDLSSDFGFSCWGQVTPAICQVTRSNNSCFRWCQAISATCQVTLTFFVGVKRI